MVVVEAMACGLPVIASRMGGLMSRVIDGVNGRLLDPGDVDQLAGAIMDYLKHPEKKKEAGDKSREIAEAKYSLDTMTDLHETVYRKVET